ncbi:hypothetical protein FRB93_003704 [Tulasnella sp. JGI-2019a]|nr:hypothetical protein FRB93_003704 [Tulasnella sp. JGI-2019a]
MTSIKRPHEDTLDGPSKKARNDAVSLFYHICSSQGESPFCHSITHEHPTITFLKLFQPGSTAEATISAAELIARKRAEVAAKLANFSALAQKPIGGTSSRGPSLSLAPPTASLPPRPSPISTPTTTNSTSKLPPGIDPDLAKKIAEAKRRADASRANIEISSNPYLAAAVAATSRKSGSGGPTPIAPPSSGLKMAAHPLLMENAPAAAPTSKKDRYKPMQPKFASIKANVRNASAPTPPPPAAITVKAEAPASANPYTSAASPALGANDIGPKDRATRSFRFIQKGKYMQLGQQMRQEAQLEDLKKRIADNSRKAGLDSEFENLEKTIRREAPPEVEWWDETLLPNKTYDDITFTDDKADLSKTLIRTKNSPITEYVQHPIPIPAPYERNKVELKPLKLTKREMKKMRKQRRMAEMQDKQDRQKMGLIPPDPPKVRLANLMRVLTSDAVQDPTKVEAKVRREVAMRKKGHEVMNAERKLTDEQRREKLEVKKVEEEKKGIQAAVFKIKTLSDPSHRFKVRKNAEQLGLTGVCIFNPSFSLVLVEGSSKSVKQYSRLMLVRIPWTEAARERDVSLPVDDPSAEPTKVKKEDGFGPGDQQVSLENNACDKVWEGPLRDRVFQNFKAKSCPTDSSARELLGEKMASYWDVAKAFVKEEDL